MHKTFPELPSAHRVPAPPLWLLHPLVLQPHWPPTLAHRAFAHAVPSFGTYLSVDSPGQPYLPCIGCSSASFPSLCLALFRVLIPWGNNNENRGKYFFKNADTLALPQPWHQNLAGCSLWCPSGDSVQHRGWSWSAPLLSSQGQEPGTIFLFILASLPPAQRLAGDRPPVISVT